MILFSKSRKKRLQRCDWWKNVFDQPHKIDVRTYDNIYDSIRNIAAGQGDDYTTGCLLDYNYFKKHYNIIVNNNKQ